MAEYQGGGDSVIYNMFTPILGIMRENDMLENKRRQEEQKALDKISQDLSKDMSKINSSGLRAVDIEPFNEQISKAKEYFYQMNRTKDRREAMMLQQKVNEAISEATRIKDLSKFTTDRFNKMSQNIVGMRGKGDINKAREYLKTLEGKRSTDILEGELNLNDFYFNYDKDKVDKDVISRIEKARRNPKLADFTEENKVTRATSGGKLYDEFDEVKTLREDSAFEILSNLARTDDNFRNYIDSIMNEQGVAYNDAIVLAMEEYSPYFSESKRERLSADKPRGNVTNINMPEQQILGAVKSLKVGNLSTDKAWTFNRDVGLQGVVDIYGTNGELLTVARGAVDFKAYNLAILPIDAQGNPIPEGSTKQPVGQKTFVTGRVLDTSSTIPEGVMSKKAEELLKDDVVIPYNELDHITMSKALRENVTSVTSQANNTKAQAPRTAPNAPVATPSSLGITPPAQPSSISFFNK